MKHLSTFAANASAVVVGATGGIGSALVRQLATDPGIAKLHQLSRRANAPDQRIDITDEDTIAAAAERLADQGPLDLVIVATGILHEGETLMPEKRMRELDAGTMQRVFAVNTFGPALVAKHFLPHMRRDAKTVFAAISARVGSIGDNQLGGWASYRASKAALNMYLKTLSIEHARTRPESAVIALHPGTVDTGLSRPFQRNVPDGKLFTPDYAAERLLGVIDGVTNADTGGFFAFDGARIDY